MLVLAKVMLSRIILKGYVVILEPYWVDFLTLLVTFQQMEGQTNYYLYFMLTNE